jgi:hypothetical protein
MRFSMIKYFFSLYLLLLINFCFSQNTPTTDYKWGITLQVNTVERNSPLEELTETSNTSAWSDDANLYRGVSGNAKTISKIFGISAGCSYYGGKGFFYRGKIGFSSLNIQLLSDEKVDTDAHYFFNAYRKQSTISSSLGIGKELDLHDFIIYCGLEIPFTFFGKATVHSHYSYDYQSVPNYYSEDLDGTIFSSYSVGLGNFIGCGIRFAKFYAGGEISYGVLYNKRLSSTDFHIVETNTSGNSMVNNISYDPLVSVIEMSKIKPSIVILYHF